MAFKIVSSLRGHTRQSPPELGATIHVAPRVDRSHWFDADTGKRL